MSGEDIVSYGKQTNHVVSEQFLLILSIQHAH